MESGDYNHIDATGKEDDWRSYRVGTFSRTAYTLAVEISGAYINHKYVRLYSIFGVGATFKKETDVYDLAYTQVGAGYYNANGYPYGRSGAYPDNVTKFDAYYSPIGISFGDALRGFIELGVGYKGFINGGLSIKLNTRSARLTDVPRHSSDPVLALPYNFTTVPIELQHIDYVLSGAPRHHTLGPFERQLNKATKAGQSEGGNVFRISDVKQGGNVERYNVIGEALYTTSYDSLKKTIEDEKTNDLKMSNAPI